MKNLFNNPFPESIISKYLRIWHELDVCAVVLCRFLYTFLEKISLGILRPGTFPVTIRCYIEVDGESVRHFYGVDSNFLRIDSNPKGYAACGRYNGLLRNSSAIIPDNGIVILYLYRKNFAESHLELIHRHDQNSLQQGVDSVLRVGTIAQLSDIHLGPPLDMLVPFKDLDAIVIKLIFCGFMILFHCCPLKVVDVVKS